MSSETCAPLGAAGPAVGLARAVEVRGEAVRQIALGGRDEREEGHIERPEEPGGMEFHTHTRSNDTQSARRRISFGNHAILPPSVLNRGKGLLASAAVRVRLSLLLLLVALLSAGALRLAAQQGGSDTPPSPGRLSPDDERKRQFLKAREEMHTAPATPAPPATPRPKPRPRATPTPEPATPRPAPRGDSPPESRDPLCLRDALRAALGGHAVSVRHPAPAPAPVTIEKSGYDGSQGLEPAPSGGGWFTKWKYLSKGVRDAIDRAPVARHRWRYIVIHNSGTRQGNAKAFDYYHLHIRKMKNGLAYHFVVGNGSSSGDGQIEIGNRWTRQINGGHVHSDYLNNIALGICLVGDFNRDLPTERQINATAELVRYLRNRVGKIDRQEAILKAHREINPPRWPTDCPGNQWSDKELHRRLDI